MLSPVLVSPFSIIGDFGFFKFFLPNPEKRKRRDEKGIVVERVGFLDFKKSSLKNLLVMIQYLSDRSLLGLFTSSFFGYSLSMD